MSRKRVVACLAILLAFVCHPAAAQRQIPETSGFSGFVLAGPGYFDVASNFLVTGSPLLDDVGENRIDSIFDPPKARSSAASMFKIELNYTFASTRTQLYFGNLLEDLLRLDLVFGLGVRQELGNAGLLTVTYLMTPFEVAYWEDPYIEGEDRTRTDLNFPGFRIRWGEIFGTGLELTISDRYYRFDTEASGDWLVDRGRLDADLQPLLDRDGDVLRIRALYRFDFGRHQLEPAVEWIDDYHKGAAIANTGYKAQVTYLYVTKKVVLDANLFFGTKKADEVNPVYGKTLNADRLGTAIMAFIPIKRYTSSVLNVFVGGEVFREDANIDFFDSSIKMVMAGVIWRHIKK